jgi:hypothetical protein
MNFNDQKKLRLEIQTLHGEGKGKSEIFNLLKEKVMPNETAWLSVEVASVLPDEIKVKYKLYNSVMSVLLTVSFLIWFYFPYKDYGPFKYVNYIFTIFYVLAIVSNVNKFNLTGVIFLGVITTVFITMKAVQLTDLSYEAWIILPAAAIYMAYNLRKKLFPEIDTLGRVKKNGNGDYIFGS